MTTILDVIAKLREDDPPLYYLEPGEDVGPGKFLEFESLEWNGSPRFAPSEALNLPYRPGEKSYMYRGHSSQYPTCYSSLIRRIQRDGAFDESTLKGHLALERFRVAELELVLRQHPFQEVAKRHGFSVDYHGLAQHYGIPTSLLDVTSSIEVAAFFAVAEWDVEQEKFKPMMKGLGDLYRFDWSALGPGYAKFFDPVGFGPGLRPARQHAWTFRLGPGEDFTQVPHLERFEFEHNESASMEIFGRFANGYRLYPPDCLSMLVEKIDKLPFVTMAAIRHAAREDGHAEDEVDDVSQRAAWFLTEKTGLDVVDGYELQLEDDDADAATKQAAALEAAIEEMRRGWRLIRRRRQEES